MRVDLEGVEIAAGDWREQCTTEIISAGGYMVAVITVVEGRHLTLASSYLADLAGASAAATHMRLAGRTLHFEHRILGLTGVTHARGCLLDHAAELRAALAELLGRDDVRVDVDDRALEQADGVWK
jgi:hypothetical protein